MPDPYDWLGIPKAHRPPTHYQLLGIAPSVRNPAEIKSAADRQLKRLQPHLTGPDGNAARILRVEVNRARETLLDPEQRAIYDTLSPDAEVIVEEPPEIDVELLADEPPAETAPTEDGGPSPWWQEAPAEEEEPSAPAAWWQEGVPPDEPAAPPPAVQPVPPPPPVRQSPKPRSAPLPKPRRESVDPEPVAVVTRTEPAPPRRPLAAIIIFALVVTGLITGGTYFVLNRKKETPPEEGPKEWSRGPIDSGPKEKPPPKENELLPLEGSAPKDFTDKLRPRMFRGHKGGVTALAVSRSGLRFYTTGADQTVRIWSVPLDDVTTRHRLESPGVAVALYDGDRGLAACDSLTVALLDTTRMVAARPLTSPRGGVSGLAVSADGSKVLTGMTDGYLRLWDVATSKFDEWAVAPRGPIAVTMTPDAATGIAAVADGPVSVWNLKTRSKVHEWTPHPGGAIAVELAPDRNRVVTSGPEGAVTVYDLAAKKELWRKPAHEGAATAAAWLADGQQVVTAGLDGVARLWNAETGLGRRWSQTLDGKATSVAVDSQDRFILVGTANGTVHLFPLPRVKAEAMAGPAARPPAEALPVPDSEAVAAALNPVRTELAAEFSYTRPDDVALLADNLRRRAAAENVVPPLRFGLLQESRALAVRAADPVTALGAVEDLAAWFEIDELAEKAITFSALPPETDAGLLTGLALTAAERAEADARPEIVQQLLRRMPPELPAGFPKDQGERVTALRKRAAIVAAELEKVRKAAATLKTAPDHQESNQTIGVFLALTRQDWTAGLPHLAKGTDPGIIEAAKADLNGSADPRGQLRIGDLWFRLAVNAADHRHKRSMLGRSRSWFERLTRAKVDVADQVKAKARLGEIDNLNVPSKDANVLPLRTPSVVRRPYNTFGADVLKSEWQLDGGATARAGGVHFPAGSPTMHSRFGLVAGGRLTFTVRPDGRELRINTSGQEFAFAGTGKSVRIVIERTEATVAVTAYPDGGEPVSRTADLAVVFRGPTRVTLRVTGVPVDANGTTVSGAVVTGPIAFPPPAAE